MLERGRGSPDKSGDGRGAGGYETGVTDEDPTTRELRVEQVRREMRHRRAAEEAPVDEARQHDRRAERAAYLRDKLEERAASERGDG
jgi:hypothetical protein